MTLNICISCATPEEEEELKFTLDLIRIDYFIHSIHHNSKSKKKKIYDAINLGLKAKKNKINVLIGSPCFANRIISRVLNIRFISYLRSVHPDATQLTSLSDKIHYLLSKLKLDSKISNPYYADTILITTPINKIFLENRGINTEEKTFEIGASWLYKINIEENSKNTDQNTFIYITQSFLSHNHMEADLEQKENILTICAKLNSSDKLIIRKHPRDETNYHELLKSFTDLKKIEINTDKPIEFLHTIHSKSYLIGSFSTLALEAMQLGGNFFPLHLHSHKNLNHLLKQYKLPPKKIDEINEIETIIEYSHSINLFSPYNPTIILNILK